jgi:hypothetical protein
VDIFVKTLPKFGRRFDKPLTFFVSPFLILRPNIQPLGNAVLQAMVSGAEIPDSHCVVFAHFLSGAKRERKGVKLSAAFAKIPQLEVNLEEEGNRYTERVFLKFFKEPRNRFRQPCSLCR